MNPTKVYISVILPLKLEWEPCYWADAKDNPCIGNRVRVMFANREYVGVISDININTTTEEHKIKPILCIEHELEDVFPKEIELWRRIAQYYMCSIGEVYNAAYPIRKINLEIAKAKADNEKEKRERLKEERWDKRKGDRIQKLQTRIEKRKLELETSLKESKITRLKAEIEMLTDNLHSVMEESYNPLCMTPDVEMSESTAPEIILSNSQSNVYNKIQECFSQKKAVLLNGITGSGKTEIYIKLAKDTLDRKRNVLFLVPEIGLSLQLENRLRHYFSEQLLVFHSGETQVRKREVAEYIRHARKSDNQYIVLGTRSSLMLPHHNLGLIIVDEEHDSSYKQNSPAPRYNGRDTASMLAVLHDANIILGSATPSLESIYNSRIGKLVKIDLKERYYGSENADIEIIDTIAERKKRGMTGSFSRKLIAHINNTLSAGGQVIILRARRAWAPILQCDECGEIVKCKHCNVSLSLHKNDNLMVCHTCGFKSAVITKCHKCGGEIKSFGSGTQKIEEEAAALFPEARICRLDSDSAQNRSFEKKAIKDFEQGKTDILIGTQIITKGFDFSNLRLVAVIGTDGMLGMNNYKADEKTLQLLEQLKGRCGRRDKKGLFVIQTAQPQHILYQNIKEDRTDEFNNHLLAEREMFRFPPYSRIVEINFEDRYENRLEIKARILCSQLHSKIVKNGVVISEAYTPAPGKIADKHLRTIRINLPKNRQLNENKTLILNTIKEFEKEQKYVGHISINVDP